MSSVRRLAGYLKPYWMWAVLAPLLMVLEVAMDLQQPRIIERIVDVGIANMDMDVVIQSGVMAVLYALLGAVGGIGCTIFASLAAQGFGADIRDDLFRKVMSLSFRDLDRLETGQLVTRLTNDVTQVREALFMLLRIMVRAPMTLIGSLIMAIATSPKLAMLFLVLMPLVLVIVAVVITKAFPLFSVVQLKLDALNNVMEENLMGVRVVKAFVRGEHEEKRFDATNSDLMNQQIRVARTVATTMPFMMLTVNAGVVAAVWLGGIQVINGELHVGAIIAFVNYLMHALMSLLMVSMLVVQISRAQASTVRIDEVLDSEAAIKNRDGVPDVLAASGRIEFDNVSFGYESDDEEQEAVLRGISFTAEPGQTVALLGSTGSGKSTLVHLIPRFYDVTEGRVLIDGIDVRDIDKSALRRQIGIAMQEPVLFSGSIRENIRYGAPDATDEQVEAAARMAQAHDFVSELPGGYESVVGQRGVNLSGGQKQRLAIARALLIRPAVLVLDDSTSAVDVETEIKIQAELDRFMEGRTSFVIAQRISTVLNADKILVLDKGRVVAEGNHEDLMESSDIYREIYESQLGNGVMAYD